MQLTLPPLRKQWRGIVSNRYFWILVVMLAGTAFLHYATS